LDGRQLWKLRIISSNLISVRYDSYVVSPVLGYYHVVVSSLL
jgi:hypothetical protein